MENLNQVKNISWEIDEAYLICEKGEYGSLNLNLFVLVVTLILMHAMDSILVLVPVCLFFLFRKHSAISKIRHEGKAITETYRLDNRGITINDIKAGTQSFYTWSELGPFFIERNEERQKDLSWETFFGLPPVERIFVFTKQGKDVKLRINKGQSEEIARELSKRLEEKNI